MKTLLNAVVARDGFKGGDSLDIRYHYPNAGDPGVRFAPQPYHELDNVLLTPHISGRTANNHAIGPRPAPILNADAGQWIEQAYSPGSAKLTL